MSLDIKNIKYFELHDFGMNDCTLQSDICFNWSDLKEYPQLSLLFNFMLNKIKICLIMV